MNSIFIYSVTYILFFTLLLFSRQKKANRLFSDNGFVSDKALLLLLHIVGILLFGIVPFFINNLSFKFYNNETTESPSSWITMFLVFALILIAPRLAQKKSIEILYTNAVNKFPGSIYVIVYFVVRILFIVAYEIWFRDIVLHDTILYFGIPVAILLNVSLYTLLHIVNGKEEVLGCIPFGFLLCCLCLWQGAIWPAIILHLALTLPYELSFFRIIKTTPSHESISHRSFRIYR